MGQKPSRDSSFSVSQQSDVGELRGDNEKKKGLHPALKSPNEQLGLSSNRSIHWAEQVATDMEHPGARTGTAHSSKKPRVRTRSEEEEYEKQLRLQQTDQLSFDAGRSETEGEDDYVDEEISEFEAILVQELKKRVKVKNEQQSPRVKNLNSILMKFPQIKEGFEKLRSVFDSVDSDGSGDIDFQEWCDAMSEHGLSVDIPQDHQLSVWREADVDGNNLIDFKEFVVVMSFLYLMDYVKVDEKNSKMLSDSNRAKRIILHEKVRNSIDYVVDAFLFFDKDGDGRIMKSEVMRGLDTSVGVSGKNMAKEGHLSSRIWKKRFTEMDCDHSGSISLKEFIFAFEDWVGFDESDDEDEMM